MRCPQKSLFDLVRLRGPRPRFSTCSYDRRQPYEHGCPEAALLYVQVEAAVSRHKDYFDVQLAVTPADAGVPGELAICWCACLKQSLT